MIDLSGKVFIVTGGNGGIGLGMAEGIVQAGGSVVVWGRKADKNDAAVATLKALGGRATAHVCDVSDEAQVDRDDATLRRGFRAYRWPVRQRRSRRHGYTVHRTATRGMAPVMSVNLDGAFLQLREAAKFLVEQGEGGSLVAVSSTSAIHGAAGNEAYGTAKTALNGLVRALAVGLARHQIRVNSLLPGWTITELAQGGYENDIFRTATVKRTPVRRWAEPAEFREVGAFLADPTQTYHTGQEICVDGGYTVF